MKILKFLFLVIVYITFTPDNVYAQQLQFSHISSNKQTLNTIPRFSWRIPLSYSFKLFDEKGLALFTELPIKNEGVIFDEKGDRFKKRAISIGPRLGIMGILNNFITYNIGFGLDYNFHYKEKYFPNKERSAKEIVVSEWFSNRVNKINYTVQFGIGLTNAIHLFGEYYFREFLNQDFTENINGIEVKPYEELSIRRFNIGIILSKEK